VSTSLRLAAEQNPSLPGGVNFGIVLAVAAVIAIVIIAAGVFIGVRLASRRHASGGTGKD